MYKKTGKKILDCERTGYGITAIITWYDKLVFSYF